MDDGNVDFSNHLMDDVSIEFDEFMRASTCTHTHTCNPPGPNAAGHTHTCFHTHTQLLSSGDETGGGREDEVKKPKRSLGNREAVRKYREKKKAHAAYLEEEVKKLRLLNQQLQTRLQGQAALEEEVVRLRGLLLGVRQKIDAELDIFPFQKQCDVTSFQCDADVSCDAGNIRITDWEHLCEPEGADCQINLDGDMERHAEVKALNSLDMVR